MRKQGELFQIGQVAEICGITRKMILNYESLGLVEPVTTDPNSGYRYYDNMTISRIIMILDMRKTGMSLPDIGKYLSGKLSVSEQILKLEAQKNQIERAILDLKRRNITEETMVVEEIHLSRQCCISQRTEADTIENAVDSFGNLYRQIIERNLKLNLSAYNFVVYPREILSPDFFETEHIHMISCICICEEEAPADATIYPECDALSICFHGTLANSQKAYELMKRYIIDNDYKVIGYPRELYMEGNFEYSENDYIMQIVVPIESPLIKS